MALPKSYYYSQNVFLETKVVLRYFFSVTNRGSQTVSPFGSSQWTQVYFLPQAYKKVEIIYFYFRKKYLSLLMSENGSLFSQLRT